MRKKVIDLKAIKYGETVLAEDLIFEGGRPDKCRPISLTIYLLITTSRIILVDAGCDTMPGF